MERMQTKDPLLPRPPSSEELERVRETLRRAESSYELLFEQAAEGIYFTDLSGVIDAANPRFCAMLGRAQGEVVGTSCGDFQGREDRRLLPERLAAVRAMRTLRGERALERADGSSFVAEVSSQLLPNDRILVMVRDITERKRAEEALRRSEANLQAVLAGNPDAVVVHVRGVVRFANPAALALLETASGEILGTRVVEWIHEGAVDVTLERIEASNRAGTALPPWECKMLRRRGGPVEAEARAIGVTFDGEPAILLVVRDIRERKRVERQLLVAERMASVGALAAGVAHEIKTPLLPHDEPRGRVCEAGRAREWGRARGRRR